MGEMIQFPNREEFRKSWMVERLNKNLKPMQRLYAPS